MQGKNVCMLYESIIWTIERRTKHVLCNPPSEQLKGKNGALFESTVNVCEEDHVLSESTCEWSWGRLYSLWIHLWIILRKKYFLWKEVNSWRKLCSLWIYLWTVLRKTVFSLNLHVNSWKEDSSLNSPCENLKGKTVCSLWINHVNCNQMQSDTVNGRLYCSMKVVSFY